MVSTRSQYHLRWKTQHTSTSLWMLESWVHDDGWSIKWLYTHENALEEVTQRWKEHSSASWTSIDPHPFRQLTPARRESLIREWLGTHTHPRGDMSHVCSSPQPWNMVEQQSFLRTHASSFPWWGFRVMTVRIHEDSATSSSTLPCYEILSPEEEDMSLCVQDPPRVLTLSLPIHGLLYSSDQQAYWVLVETSAPVFATSKPPKHDSWFRLYLFLAQSILRQQGIPIVMGEYVWIDGDHRQVHVLSMESHVSSLDKVYHDQLCHQLCQWVKDMLSFPLHPFHPCFYPNMKYNPSWYPLSLVSAKRQHAMHIREWTLLPYLGIAQRQSLRERDPPLWTMQEGAFAPEDIGSYAKHYQYCVLQSLSRFSKGRMSWWASDHARSWIQRHIRPYSHALFVDFEWVSSGIYLIGVLEWNRTQTPLESFSETELRHSSYRAFWANDLSGCSEYQLLNTFYEYVQSYRQAHSPCPVPLYYYYAEKQAWERSCSKFCKDTEFLQTVGQLFEHQDHSPVFDIHELMWKGPVLFRHCYTTKLKDIGSCMMNEGHLPSSWSLWKGDITEGGSSIQKALEYYQRPSSHSQIRDSLQKYNAHDCLALAGMWQWCRSIVVDMHAEMKEAEITTS